VFSFGVVVLELLTGKLQLGGNQRGLDLVDEVVAEDELPQHRDARAGAWPPAAIEALELLATQCVETKPRMRPSSLAVLQQLNRLQNEHCSLSADETLLKHELAAAHAELEKLRIVEDVADVERIATKRSCAVCLEDGLPLAGGIECAAGHFTCNTNGCLTRCVEVQSAASQHELERRKGQIGCSLCPVDAPPFSAAAVAMRIPEATFATLHAVSVRASEVRRIEEMQADFDKRLQDMSMEFRMAEAGSVARKRAFFFFFVVEKILTLHCPSCDQAWAEKLDKELGFTACCALTCVRCSAGFCAWCLAHCGRDAHTHVASCVHNKSPGKEVYCTAAAFEAAQRQRRECMLRTYLAEQDGAVRAPLLAQLATDLRHLGMDAAAFL
jgi:hypothetical protein